MWVVVIIIVTVVIIIQGLPHDCSCNWSLIQVLHTTSRNQLNSGHHSPNLIISETCETMKLG